MFTLENPGYRFSRLSRMVNQAMLQVNYTCHIPRMTSILTDSASYFLSPLKILRGVDIPKSELLRIMLLNFRGR